MINIEIKIRVWSWVARELGRIWEEMRKGKSTIRTYCAKTYVFNKNIKEQILKSILHQNQV